MIHWSFLVFLFGKINVHKANENCILLFVLKRALKLSFFAFFFYLNWNFLLTLTTWRITCVDFSGMFCNTTWDRKLFDFIRNSFSRSLFHMQSTWVISVIWVSAAVVVLITTWFESCHKRWDSTKLHRKSYRISLKNVAFFWQNVFLLTNTWFRTNQYIFF